MKRIITAVLTLLSTINLLAQAIENGEAFYIYRNDGDFNGFFYDDVQEMRFSKVDFEGVEHDEYVIQEVVTADSVYRIPVSAIDSISFIQPEIKLNPRLKVMDGTDYETCLLNYGSNYSNIPFINFNSNLPNELVPEVGDVLVGLDDNLFTSKWNGMGSNGCAGKVKEVNRYSWGTHCIVEPLSELSDVFVQFVSVEQVGTTPSGQVRRRMAGLNTMKSPRPVGGNFSVSLINFSGTLQKEWKPNSKTSVTFGLNLGAEMKLSLVYNITWSQFYVKLVLSEGFEVGGSIKAAVETGGEENFPFGPAGDMEIKFPATLPMFGVKPIPKAFVRTKGELSATVNFPKFQWGSTQTLIFDSRAEKFATAYLSDKDCPGDDDSELFTATSGGIAWNGFFQTGIKEDATINTNSWFKGIFYTSYGMEIYAGPKLEGEINLSVDGLMSDGAYGLLKDSKVEYSAFSIDLENKARMQYLWHDPEERTFWSSTKKFGTSTWFLFPDFKKTDAEYDAKTGNIIAAVHPRRQVFWKSWVGAGIYDKDGNRIAEKFKEDESYNLVNSFNEFKTEFGAIPAGHYTVRPLLRTLGCVVSAESAEENVDVTPQLKLSTDSISFDSGSHYESVNFTTNAKTVDVRGYQLVFDWNHPEGVYALPSGENEAWLEVFPADNDNGKWSVGISIKKNPTLFDRRGMVIIAAHEEDLWVRDTIKIWQPGSAKVTGLRYEGNLKVSRNGTVYGNPVNDKIQQSFNSSCPVVSTSRNGNLLTITCAVDTTTVPLQTVTSSSQTTKHTITAVIDLSKPNGQLVEGSIDFEGDYYCHDEIFGKVKENYNKSTYLIKWKGNISADWNDLSTYPFGSSEIQQVKGHYESREIDNVTEPYINRSSNWNYVLEPDEKNYFLIGLMY